MVGRDEVIKFRLNYWNSRTYKLLFTISVELEGVSRTFL